MHAAATSADARACEKVEVDLELSESGFTFPTQAQALAHRREQPGSNLARLHPETLAMLRRHPRVSNLLRCLSYE